MRVLVICAPSLLFVVALAGVGALRADPLITESIDYYGRSATAKAIELARRIEIGISGLPPIQSRKGLEHSADHLAHNLIKNFHR